MLRTRFLVSFAVLLLSLIAMTVPVATVSAFGSSKSSPFPITISAANRSVTVSTKPTAIVSLSATATEMLYAIGAGKQVKAVDKYSDYPKGTPMTSLDGTDPNVEAIAAYHPDLVVVSQDTPSFDNQFHALGIPVIEDPAAADLQQAYQQFIGLGKATGHLAQAEGEVALIERQIGAIVKKAPKLKHTETYYYELDPTFYSETSTTFIGQVLGLLHLRSIADAATGAASSGGYPQLSDEFILKAKPDYIFLADTLCCRQNVASISARPGWKTIPAVKDDRILGLNDDIASRWGPRIVVLLQEVADELKGHPVSGS